MAGLETSDRRDLRLNCNMNPFSAEGTNGKARQRSAQKKGKERKKENKRAISPLDERLN